MTDTDEQGASTVPSKATLFCGSCGYQSYFDGNWETVETPRRVTHYCPSCGDEVVTNPSDCPPCDTFQVDT